MDLLERDDTPESLAEVEGERVDVTTEMGLVEQECIICHKVFCEPPHPLTGKAFHYTCPACRRAVKEQTKGKGWRDASGYGHYRG